MRADTRAAAADLRRLFCDGGPAFATEAAHEESRDKANDRAERRVPEQNSPTQQTVNIRLKRRQQQQACKTENPNMRERLGGSRLVTEVGSEPALDCCKR